MISVKDRRLLQEALDWRCDAFMTMERRLPTAAAFIERQTGLRVMTADDVLGPAEPFRPAVPLTAQRASLPIAARSKRPERAPLPAYGSRRTPVLVRTAARHRQG